MKKHKFESLIRFIKLDGVKEFKDTDPSLFSEDGISTTTMEVENNKTATVTMDDARNACQKFLNNEISLFQLQQWGEWIHMMDFFDLIPNGDQPDNDETLIEIITQIDMLDLENITNAKTKVKEILKNINDWSRIH